MAGARAPTTSPRSPARRSSSTTQYGDIMASFSSRGPNRADRHDRARRRPRPASTSSPPSATDSYDHRHPRLHLRHVDGQPARRRRRRAAHPGPSGLDAGADAVGVDDHGPHRPSLDHDGAPATPYAAGRRAHRRRRGGPRRAALRRDARRLRGRQPGRGWRPEDAQPAVVRRHPVPRRVLVAAHGDRARQRRRRRCPPTSRGPRRPRPTTGSRSTSRSATRHGVAWRLDRHRGHRRRLGGPRSARPCSAGSRSPRATRRCRR